MVYISHSVFVGVCVRQQRDKHMHSSMSSIILRMGGLENDDGGDDDADGGCRGWLNVKCGW